jgi:hypothetical protein
MPTRTLRNSLTTVVMVSIITSLVLSLVTSVFADSSYTGSAVQQNRERLLHRLRVEGPEVEPIVITDIKVNEQSVSFDTKFSANDDWMKSLTFSVKNRSDKLILLASLWLRFPRPPGSSDIESISHMSYGNDELVARKPTSEERLVGLAPGQTVDIHFTAEAFQYLPIFLSATGYPPSIQKVNFEIFELLFEDDTMWNQGDLLKRDKDNLNSWKRVKPSGLSKGGVSSE